MASTVRERETSWVFVVPVENLRLTSEVDRELKVNCVTLVDGDRLPYVRKRLGFPERISEYREAHGGIYGDFFSEPDTFAVVRRYGKLVEIKEELLQQIRDALSIVSLSALGFSPRHLRACPKIAGEQPLGSHRYFSTDSLDGGIAGGWHTFGPVGPLTTTPNWKRFHDELFFTDLLDILHRKVDIGSSWREDLRSAAILAGQSQASLDLSKAFLWNIIVIELLLTPKHGERGETKEHLSERAEAFLGWSGWWEEEGFHDAIEEVWDKRVGLVHKAERDAITLEDLFFTDNLVLNLFMNIVEEIERFDSKEAIIEFSKKVQAERILGIEPSIRPSSLRLVRPSYSEKELEKTSYHR